MLEGKDNPASRDVNGSDRIGYCYFHIVYHIILMDSDRIDGFEYGLYRIADTKRIRTGLGSDADNRINKHIKIENYFFIQIT